MNIAKTGDWHKRSIHLCFTREALGGVPAFESSLMERSIMGLKNLGMEDAEIAKVISDEMKLFVPNAA